MAIPDSQQLSSPPVNAADLGTIENMGRVAASTEEVPLHADAASQTTAEYTVGPDKTVTLTLAEPERLWGRKHADLLKEFGVMMASRGEYYEQPFEMCAPEYCIVLNESRAR